MKRRRLCLIGLGAGLLWLPWLFRSPYPQDVPPLNAALHGRHFRFTCWQAFNEGGWYTLTLPEEKWDLITGPEGIDHFYQVIDTDAARGNFVLTVAEADTSHLRRLECWERDPSKRWARHSSIDLPLDPIEHLTCSPNKKFAALISYKNNRAGIYRVDLNSKKFKWVAPLRNANQLTVNSLACGDMGEIYVCQKLQNHVTSTCYDRRGIPRSLLPFDYINTNATGVYGLQVKVQCPQVDMSVQNLSRPQLNVQHFRCNAVEIYRRWDPGNSWSRWACNIAQPLSSQEGLCWALSIGIEDKTKLFHIGNGGGDSFWVFWQTGNKIPIYALHGIGGSYTVTGMGTF